jgi:hypothetical protein
MTNPPSTNVAVVRRCCTSDPCPDSVIAKQPGSAREMMSRRYFSWCRSVPSICTAPPNSPHWTPAFTISDRSPYPSSWNDTTDPPMSPSPP